MITMVKYILEGKNHKTLIVNGTLAYARKRAISWGRKNANKWSYIAISKVIGTRRERVGLMNLLYDVDVYKWEIDSPDGTAFKAYFVNPVSGQTEGLDDIYMK